MSLRARLALAMVLMVVLTLGLAWGVTGRAVLGPFASAVFQEHLRQAVSVAERLEDGATLEALSEETELELRVLPGPPDEVERGRRGGPEGRGRRGRGGERGEDDWIHKELRGHAVMFRPHARTTVAVETSLGWVMVRRQLDVDAPARRVGPFLLVLAVAVALGAVALAVMATRPLHTAQRAMERIAEGELDHRLEVRGPPELMSAARTFNAMVDRMEGMLRREKELMAGLSHELRTPLTRLNLELELLRDAGVSERRIDAMAGDLAELERLIQEMLSVSRLELGQTQLHLRATALSAVVRDALAAQPLPDHVVLIEGEGDTLSLDHELAVRALGNLLSNARRYAPAGSEVRVELDGPCVRVLDRGPGVSEADLKRLFEPFFRAEGSRSKATGGLGLGLMIVKQVMELHGGEVSVALREGGGLQVELRFPADGAT